MSKSLGKVTTFITHRVNGRKCLLLFEHPTAGNQIPGGTIEEGEYHGDAAEREAREETGLHKLKVKKYIGSWKRTLPKDQYRVLRKTKVYSRPDETSFDWATFRSGIPVTILREEGEFYQVQYREFDQLPHSNYVTYSIIGWVPKDTLTNTMERHFYHLILGEDGYKDLWMNYSDHHLFRLFWGPLDSLPEIIPTQQVWLEYIYNSLNYRF